MLARVKDALARFRGEAAAGPGDADLVAPTPRLPVVKSGEDAYDVAYRWGWAEPSLRDLVTACYKTPDLPGNARRFEASAELQAALEQLRRAGAGPAERPRLLDFGCGNGIGSYALARAGYRVTGADSSQGELAGVRAARQLVGIDGAAFDVHLLTSGLSEFSDASFDVVWMREVLHHIRDLAPFLSEVRRVLSPGGIVFCMRDVVVWNEHQRAHFFAHHPFHPITGDEGCFALEEYLAAFRSAGLTMVEVLDPVSSMINTYPEPLVPGRTFDPAVARTRQEGYDLFSFLARRDE